MREMIKKMALGIWLLLECNQLLAEEAIGYKILLSSFQTLDDANRSLHILGDQIGKKEFELLERYHYDLVARPSGDSFIIAIEPFSSKEDAKHVKKLFDQYYSDAYINGYYGPTEGTITYSRIQKSKSVMASSTIDSSVEDNPMDRNHELKEHQERSSTFQWVIVFGSIIVGLVGFLMIHRFRSEKKRLMNHHGDTITIDSFAEKMIPLETEVEPAVESAPLVRQSNAEHDLKNDIFYKLQKNIFFKTLLDELQKAAQAKNDQRCKEILEEIIRYQKNYKQSRTITLFQEYIEQNQFDKLLKLINEFKV